MLFLLTRVCLNNMQVLNCCLVKTDLQLRYVTLLLLMFLKLVYLRNVYPVAFKLKRQSADDLKFIETEIKNFLEDGIFEEGRSPFRY